MDDAHEHDENCEHGTTEAIDIPEVYMPLIRLLASKASLPDKIEGMVYSTFRQVALKRGLPVARATATFVVAASAFDHCVRRMRYAALGTPIDNDEVEMTKEFLEEGRKLMLQAIDDLQKRLVEARAAYSELYLVPDGVNPKEESRAVMQACEREDREQRERKRSEFIDAIGLALATMFNVPVKSGEEDTAQPQQ